MTRRPTVLHLVDDTTAGGVMRVVDFLVTSGDLQAQARHVTQQVARGDLRNLKFFGDVLGLRPFTGTRCTQQNNAHRWRAPR